MEGAWWVAGGSATVVGLSGYWWYRLRRIEWRAEQLTCRMRLETAAPIDASPAP
jgi:hypothetical protein